MAGYSIRIKASAAKEIDRLPTRAIRRRIVERIAALAEDPRPAGCEKLSGRDGYRVRQGVYRIVYSIHDDHLVVEVIRVAHRKDVYRK